MRKPKILFLLCLLFLSVPAIPAATAEFEKLNVVYSSISGASISTWVPKEAGIYKKYGLDVNLIYVAGSQAITTLISGDAQVVQGSGAAAILSRLVGSEVKIIGNVINVIPMSLVVTADIGGPADLKGKTFGVSRFGSLTDLGLRKAVGEWGIDAAKDIKMIQTGGVPENLLFMQQGIIKGALLSSPTLEKAKELGFKEMLNLANINYRYPGTALVATDAFIKNQPQTLNRFLKATVEGIKFAKTNPELTVKTLAKYTRTPDTKLLESAFRTYVLGYIRDVPTVSANEIETALEEIAARNPKAKGADPGSFFDPAPLDQLAKEGFVRQLYPR
jgi:NitT/TauT family transport system substrate-binding protein